MKDKKAEKDNLQGKIKGHSYHPWLHHTQDLRQVQVTVAELSAYYRGILCHAIHTAQDALGIWDIAQDQDQMHNVEAGIPTPC